MLLLSPLLVFGILFLFAASEDVNKKSVVNNDFEVDYETASSLAGLAIECHDQEWPHKYGTTYESEADLQTPQEKHPIFYGCFDWHSAVHGHWLMASAANRFSAMSHFVFPMELAAFVLGFGPEKFPGTELATQVEAIFDAQFTAEKVAMELQLFEQEYNYSFERTYGWAWFLKLMQELRQNPMDAEKGWSATLQPLADDIVAKFKDFLPSLVYPVRVGEHTNTAFGLIFAYDYAKDVGDSDLLALIEHNATSHFRTDQGCPLEWEPSGYDFLSPCLQEADLMGRVITDTEGKETFELWLRSFLPQLFDENFVLEPGQVIDRTDGKLVHLDGVNFSRAWNLYSLITALPEGLVKEKIRFLALADEHVNASKDYVVDSDYSGSHWLASFLFYSLDRREDAIEAMTQ